MKIKSIFQLNQSSHAYRIAVILSSVSVVFGILREFIIVGFLGFSTGNDKLQLYLSIFYTVGLSIDAMRLSCLNLYSVLPLQYLILLATIIGLPFTIVVAMMMSYTTGGLNVSLLIITIVGSYLNLIAALLIIYLQRHNLFLSAQLINVMPNFILIPGILISFWYLKTNLIFAIICLTTLIPVAQCGILIFLLHNNSTLKIDIKNASFGEGVMTFARHFAAMSGEQFFQIIARSAFYHYGTGYLSVYAIVIRIYSAVRFILIDSFIGSKLSNWNTEVMHSSRYLLKIINSTMTAILFATLALIISLKANLSLVYSSIQMIAILIIGFYFSTLVRLIYFKINHHENNSTLVIQFATYEMLCAIVAYFMTTQFNHPILAILWLGYIAKPLAQLLLLRRRYHGLSYG